MKNFLSLLSFMVMTTFSLRAAPMKDGGGDHSPGHRYGFFDSVPNQTGCNRRQAEEEEEISNNEQVIDDIESQALIYDPGEKQKPELLTVEEKLDGLLTRISVYKGLLADEYG